MNKVYIGIGTNVGDRLLNIKNTLKLLNESENLFRLKFSSIYETLPYGDIEQNNFYNAVIICETNFDFHELLIFTKSIEEKIGRIKRENWGPREIDLDILLFNDLVYEDDKIAIPHKDLINRDFVLEPLLELDENIKHPETKIELREYLKALTDKYILSKFILELEKNIENDK